MISINATLAAQLIHFLILLFILNRLMLQPLLKVIREREDYTKETKGRIRELEDRIDQLKEEFISKENGARKEASQERSALMNAGLSEAEGYLNTSREEVTTIRAKADKEVEAEVNQTQPLLEDEASGLVEGIMEKIIGRRAEA